MVLQALADSDPADPCRCHEAPGPGIIAEVGRFGVNRSAPEVGEPS
jgi:hypothetical protein